MMFLASSGRDSVPLAAWVNLKKRAGPSRGLSLSGFCRPGMDGAESRCGESRDGLL